MLGSVHYETLCCEDGGRRADPFLSSGCLFYRLGVTSVGEAKGNPPRSELRSVLCSVREPAFFSCALPRMFLKQINKNTFASGRHISILF